MRSGESILKCTGTCSEASCRASCMLDALYWRMCRRLEWIGERAGFERCWELGPILGDPGRGPRVEDCAACGCAWCCGCLVDSWKHCLIGVGALRFLTGRNGRMVQERRAVCDRRGFGGGGEAAFLGGGVCDHACVSSRSRDVCKAFLRRDSSVSGGASAGDHEETVGHLSGDEPGCFEQ